MQEQIKCSTREKKLTAREMWQGYPASARGDLIMAALVQQFSVVFLFMWAVAAGFPAGPGWEWVSSMAEMGGREFGEVAEPLVKMTHNAQYFPGEITPIQGWALSVRVEPLWQAEEAGVLALVYEEVEVEAQLPRAVIAFRGHKEGNELDACAMELVSDDPDDVNSTLVAWCYATYNASSLDYYSQAVAYTMRVLESYPASSVLLSGTSMGALVVDLAAAGVMTHYSVDLPVVAFMIPGRRRTMVTLGISLQGRHTPIMGAANEWDPIVRLDFENRIGTVCLFPTEKPDVCSACYVNTSISLLPSHDRSVKASRLQGILPQNCYDCASLTHDSLLLLRLMQEGVNPTCYPMQDIVSSTAE